MSGVDIHLQINIRARKFARSLNECGKCPKTIYFGNGGDNKFFTGGTMNIHSSHLARNMLHSSKIVTYTNTALGGKYEVINNKPNVYKKYPGQSGGSGGPIRNQF